MRVYLAQAKHGRRLALTGQAHCRKRTGEPSSALCVPIACLSCIPCMQLGTVQTVHMVQTSPHRACSQALGSLHRTLQKPYLDRCQDWRFWRIMLGKGFAQG